MREPTIMHWFWHSTAETPLPGSSVGQYVIYIYIYILCLLVESLFLFLLLFFLFLLLLLFMMKMMMMMMMMVKFCYVLKRHFLLMTHGWNISHVQSKLNLDRSYEIYLFQGSAVLLILSMFADECVYLFDGFKHGFYFPFHIWTLPSHWRTQVFQDG